MAKKKRDPVSRKQRQELLSDTAHRFVAGLMIRLPGMSKADARRLRNDLMGLVVEYNIEIPEAT